MRTMNRLEQPFRGATTLQEQINRMFGDVVGRTGEESNLTPWAPAVDIYSLANSVNAEAIKADYQNGVLTLSIPKREEAKPKQIKVNVGTPALSQGAPQQKPMAAVAGAR